MSINWFPGHMAKALRDIQNISHIDLVLEIVDARAIKTSSNPELTKTFKKPKLTIALKSDLADLDNNQITNNLIIGSIKNKNLLKEITKALDQIFATKKENLKGKGLINPEFFAVVVGLPNVGKSSLINFLSSKSNLQVANRPGVTRSQQLIKISNNYFLYDTPGVLVKKVNTDEDGYKLALIGVVKKEVLPLREVIQWGYQYFQKHYPNLIKQKYGANSQLNFHEFLNFICNKYKFVSNNGALDQNRALDFLYKDWVNNWKVNYEK